MQQPERVVSMVRAAQRALHDAGYGGRRSVSVKMRVLADPRRTADFVRAVEDAGADFLTVHGRTRSTRSSQPVDVQAIKLAAEHATRMPVLANGDVFTRRDAEERARETGTDGVMAARGLLENPALFRGDEGCPWEAVESFMAKVVKRPIPFKLVVHHLTEMCGSDRAGGTGGVGKGPLLNKEERMGLVGCGSMLELMDFLDSVRTLRRLE
jgi:tRNA-dihydrouridine synthase 4